MFLFVYLRGWLWRALWRCGIVIHSTAPSLRTAYLAYGILPHPRRWVDDWYQAGLWATEDGQKPTLRSNIAWTLRGWGL